MATSSNPSSGETAAATRRRNATRKSATTTKTNAKRTATSARRTTRNAASATVAESNLLITHAQQIAERAVLVPVGATLVARDNLVSTVKGIADKYGTRASVERELERYERRGALARNRFEREVRSVRKDLERRIGPVA